MAVTGSGGPRRLRVLTRSGVWACRSLTRVVHGGHGMAFSTFAAIECRAMPTRGAADVRRDAGGAGMRMAAGGDTAPAIY